MFNKASSLIWLVQRFSFVLLKNTTHAQKKECFRREHLNLCSAGSNLPI